MRICTAAHVTALVRENLSKGKDPHDQIHFSPEWLDGFPLL